MTSTKITSYTVFYSTNAPRIWLFNDSKLVGHAMFLRGTDPLPADKQADNQTWLYYHLADFANVLDILRNEQPIFLAFNGPGAGSENAIVTGSEPVGEGE